jgi:hypothetical protein
MLGGVFVALQAQGTHFARNGFQLIQFQDKIDNLLHLQAFQQSAGGESLERMLSVAGRDTA